MHYESFAGSNVLAEMTVRLADFSLGDMAKKYRIAHFARAQKSRKPLANGNGPNNRFVLHHMQSKLELTVLILSGKENQTSLVFVYRQF